MRCLCWIIIGILLLFIVAADHAIALDDALSAVSVTSLQPRISEVLWMGSDVSTADEWIELTVIDVSSTQSRDPGPLSLSGFTLTALNSKGEEVVLMRFGALHQIAIGEFHVISNDDRAKSRLDVDTLATTTALSLPNNGLLLRLRDPMGNAIDEVDDGIGAPFAGSNSTGKPKASMERVDLYALGTVLANWKTSTVSIGFDVGEAIFGTPGCSPLQAFSSQSSSPSSSLIQLLSSVIPPTSSSAMSFSSPSSFSSSPSFSSDVSSESSEEAAKKIIENNNSSIQFQSFIETKNTIKNSIQISEVLPDPIGSDSAEWIEIISKATERMFIEGLTVIVGTHTFILPAGSMIDAGVPLLLPRSQTALSLVNAGGSVSLVLNGDIVDTLAYSAVPEGIAFGRLSDGEPPGPLCLPTPGSANVFSPAPVVILLESGETVGVGKLTVNLQAVAASGSLAGSICAWDFGDGAVVQGCNPGPRSITRIGISSIFVSVKDYCGNTVEQSIAITINPPPVYAGTVAEAASSIKQCRGMASTGILLSEVFPNPAGKERGGEWIELQSTISHDQSLCGWSIEIGSGSKKRIDLSPLMVKDSGYLTLDPGQSHLTLRNADEDLRLIAPLPGGGTGTAMSLGWEHAPEGQSYAFNDIPGVWQWTASPSPSSANVFPEESVAIAHLPIRIARALPNPEGIDGYSEWIELENLSGAPINLAGWSIVTSAKQKWPLHNLAVEKVGTLRLELEGEGISLGNGKASVQLLDPAGSIVSVLAWEMSDEGHPIEAFAMMHHVSAVVRQIIDGDTIVVRINDPCASVDNGPARTIRGQGILILPDEAQCPTHEAIIRLLGIDAPEMDANTSDEVRIALESKNLVSDLLLNKKIDLYYDTLRKDAYGRILAYVIGENWLDIQKELLAQGLAYAYRSADAQRFSEFLFYEALARDHHQGMWAEEQMAEVIDGRIRMQERWISARLSGPHIELLMPETMSDDPDGKRVVIASNFPIASVKMRGGGGTARYQLVLDPMLRSTYQNTHYRIPRTGSILVQAESVLDIGGVEQKSVVTGAFIADAQHSNDIRINEIYPSPNAGESEWIELHNGGMQDIDLAGWSIDDDDGGKGSKAKTIPPGAVIPAGGYILFDKSLTNLSLKNAGETVSLLLPDGTIAHTLAYPNTAKGRAYAQTETGEFCLTYAPTPLVENICLLSKKTVRKNVSSTGLKPKKSSIKKSKNTIDPLFMDALQSALANASGSSLHLEGGNVGGFSSVLPYLIGIIAGCSLAGVGVAVRKVRLW